EIGRLHVDGGQRGRGEVEAHGGDAGLAHAVDARAVGADDAAAAAVRRVGGRGRLAAVDGLVGVAVGVAGRARAVADGRGAARDDVVARAGHSARAAVAGAAGEIDLATVGLLVVIAVAEAGIAGADARAGDALRGRVVGGAGDRAGIGDEVGR